MKGPSRSNRHVRRTLRRKARQRSALAAYLATNSDAMRQIKALIARYPGRDWFDIAWSFLGEVSKNMIVKGHQAGRFA